MLRSIVRLLGRTLTALGGILLLAALLILLFAFEAPGAPDILLVWFIVFILAGTPTLALGRLFQWLVHDDWPNEKTLRKWSDTIADIL